MFEGKRYWIVGASEGLGHALAQALDAKGAALVLSARNADRLTALAEGLHDAAPLPLDVTDRASIEQAAAQAGEVDGVIYCAGFYEPANAADWARDAVEAMCEVNFMGAVRLLGRVVPGFAARGAGHVVLIGSLAGYRGLPDSVGYGASKAGLMNLGESLYADLRRKGVKVQVISPGFIKTRLTEKNAFAMPQIMSPEEAAAHVVKAMESGRMSTAFPRPFAWLFTWGRFLPARLFSRILGV
ncbi:MAG: SDR family NAD(P)-dependent oxidoreductase [Paracoccaceae bacterium]